MEQAVALDPASPDAYSALGAAQFAASNPAAGASFEKAVSLQPRSIDARIALANYHWAVGNHGAAEADLQRALEIDGTSAAARRALALMYLVDRRPLDAEPHFKALAAQSATGRLALADFYAGTARLDEALAILTSLAGDAEVGRAAQIRTATIVRQKGDRTKALQIADALIRSRPTDADAHALKARLLLTAPADARAALTEATAAVRASPDSSAAQYTLGLAEVANRRYDAAEAAFRQTLKLNPRAQAAQVQISRLRLVRGDLAGAETAAEDAASARPDDVQAAVVLARTLRQRGDLDRARRVVTARLQNAADSESGWVELGEIELAAHHLAEARAALQRARASGGDGGERTQLLAARLDLSSGNTADAETRLQGLVKRNPDRLEAYELLAACALARGSAGDALARYRALAARAPDEPGPATMVGVLLQETNDAAGARAQYQAVLAKNPRAGIAANNLAWMLAEDGDYENALRWATTAVESLHGRPEPQDTLGWVYLKMARPLDALAAFERARGAAPHEPLYAQHADEARKALANR
jgi:tetratricopeptide (TPR) repeat protein